MSVPTEVATLAITGPDWFGSLADSRCSHWQPKMIHLDMAVDRGDYDAPTDRAVAATRDRLKLPEHFALYPAKAMTADVPVACSTVTCLPAITGGAAELFDPTDPNAISVEISGKSIPRAPTHMNGWDWVDQAFGELAFFGPACTAASGGTRTMSQITGVVSCKNP